MPQSQAGEKNQQAGLVALLGSGETAALGREVFAQVFRRLPRPISVAVLDTPAGFQPNADLVAGKVAEFVTRRLQEFSPSVTVVRARYKGGPDDTNSAHAREVLAGVNCIFAGPGSPGFMIRQLQDSQMLLALRERHLRGAALVFSSAAALGASAHALPIYEIFKAGADLHWLAGLDLLGPFGFHLTIVPHWNNKEGGEELDTSHCFMGLARFERLQALLPPQETILGIDEHTACLLDLAAEMGQVLGRGTLTLLRQDMPPMVYRSGDRFPLAVLKGELHSHAEWVSAPAVVAPLLSVADEEDEGAGEGAMGISGLHATDNDLEEDMASSVAVALPPPAIEQLLEIRGELRREKKWALADKVRDALKAAGVVVEDTPEGPRWSYQPGA
jgi:cyanophycinase-like exopeptidase